MGSRWQRCVAPPRSFTGLFADRFVPEFVMTSLDGRMVLETTMWGDGTVSTLVVRPDRRTESAT